MHTKYVWAITKLGNSPHTHLHASTPHHQTTHSKHKSALRKQEFSKFQISKQSSKWRKLTLEGRMMNENRCLMMNECKIKHKDDREVWKFRKFGVKTEWDSRGKRRKTRKKKKVCVCACVCVREKGKFFLKIFVFVPLKRYVLAALAVDHFLLFFFERNKNCRK